MRKNKENKKNRQDAGFSVVELVVVIAIMSVLVAAVAPMFTRYIYTNRADACRTNREALLAIFERCVYAETKALETDDLELVVKGTDTQVGAEAKQYNECPSGGEYTWKVTTQDDVDAGNATAPGIAVIECDCEGHENVSVEFTNWMETYTEATPISEQDLPIPHP